MAAYLSQSVSVLPSPTYPPRSPRTGGILLNSARPPRHAATYPGTTNYYLSPASASAALQPQLPSSPIASGSSSDVSTDGASPSSASRKIRFAPLPDPRRIEPTTPTLSSTASLSDTSDISTPQDAPQPTVTVTPDEADKCSVDTNSDDMDNSTICRISSRDSATINGRESKKGWGKKLLRPFLKSSSSPTRFASQSPSDESTGGLGLFRMSSRDSTSDVSPPNGRPSSPNGPRNRGRRGSTGNAPSPLRTAIDLPSPIIPLSATVSDSGRTRPRKHKQRMLNGRVYGSRSMDNNRSNYTEPEFVEWGYGGMGSNSNSHASAGPDYAKLQSGAKVTVGAHQEAEEEDDGSGMTWVKRRRAQREREKLEKEKESKEAEQKTEEHAVSQGTSTPTAASSHTPHTSRSSSPTRAPPAIAHTRSNSTIISIPAPPHHHHHHHHTTAKAAADVEVDTSTSSSPVSPAANTTDKAPSISGSSDADLSNTEDEAEEEEEDSNTEDEDEDLEEQNRKTSVCAGVEKISRHHE